MTIYQLDRYKSHQYQLGTKIGLSWETTETDWITTEHTSVMPDESLVPFFLSASSMKVQLAMVSIAWTANAGNACGGNYCKVDNQRDTQNLDTHHIAWIPIIGQPIPNTHKIQIYQNAIYNQARVFSNAGLIPIDPRNNQTINAGSVGRYPLRILVTEFIGILPLGWTISYDEQRTGASTVYYVSPSQQSMSFDPRIPSNIPSLTWPFDRRVKFFYDQLELQFKDGKSLFEFNRHRLDPFAEWIVLKFVDIKILKRPLRVHFANEIGIDGCGLSRYLPPNLDLSEFFSLVSEQYFSSSSDAFKLNEETNFLRIQVLPRTTQNRSLFKFIGKMMAYALFQHRQMNVRMEPSIYRVLLQQKPAFEDLEAIDPMLYKNLRWMLAHSVEDMGLTFSVDVPTKYGMRQTPLCQNGVKLSVTDDNKSDYVTLYSEWVIYKQFKIEYEIIASSFYELIPLSALKILSAQHLEDLLNGERLISALDWKENTRYTAPYSQSHPTIQLFWKFVWQMEDSERGKLLRFVTGSNRLPPGGFSKLMGFQAIQLFTIRHTTNITGAYPCSHTCFNQLDLPPYETFDDLAGKLKAAMNLPGVFSEI